MDITSLPSLSDFFEGADQWGEVLALLPVLVLLELILSADNAVALAAIARSSSRVIGVSRSVPSIAAFRLLM